MYFHRIEPNPILGKFVQCYWALSESRNQASHEHGVIPGGYVDIVFNLGDQVCSGDSGGIFFDAARTSIAGPFDRFLRLRASGPLDSLGVRFHLGKTPFHTSLPLAKMRNQSVRLDAILSAQDLKAELRKLELRLLQVSDTVGRIASIEAFLIRLVDGCSEPDAIVIKALRMIEEQRGQISVEAIALAVSISERQLERKFARQVGLSPKALCRVVRFRHAKNLLEKVSAHSAGDLVYDCGYYDQTHLIREFRVFTGQTPAHFHNAHPVGFFLYDFKTSC